MAGPNIRNLLSNFPGGFKNGVTIQGLPILNSYSGNVHWVDSNHGSDGNHGDFNRPFATLAYAVGRTTATQGDVIMLKSGHTETIVAAGGITQATDGVSIIGLGVGSDRPVITFSTAASASFLITGTNSALVNIVGVAGINALTNPFNIQAADVFLDIEWRDGSSSIEANRAVLTSAAATRFNCNLRYIGFPAGSSCVNGIRLVGTADPRITIDFYGKASTAVVEFATTLCTDVGIAGTFYVSGTTDLSKNVVDTITGSTWSVQGFDAAAGILFDGGSAKAVTGTDVSSVLAIVGAKTDAAVYVPGSASLEAYAKGSTDLQEGVAVSTAAVMTNGGTAFTVAGGPIQVLSLFALCVTGNDTTASTLQYQSAPTVGTPTTITGASATLASALAGATVTVVGTALSTAPVVNANGPALSETTPLLVPAGTIKTVIGVGSTTGTWQHFIRYRPLAKGVTVS